MPWVPTTLPAPGKYWHTQPTAIVQAPIMLTAAGNFGVPSYCYWVPIMQPPCGKYWHTQAAATKN